MRDKLINRLKLDAMLETFESLRLRAERSSEPSAGASASAKADSWLSGFERGQAAAYKSVIEALRLHVLEEPGRSPEAARAPEAPKPEAPEPALDEPPCEHDSHDHGICLDCEADISDSLRAMAEDFHEGDR